MARASSLSLVVGLAALIVLPAYCTDAGKPQPRVIVLDSPGYKQILSGPPESIRMKSGYVVLAPNESVGKHSTGKHEELLVVLEGQGVMSFANGTKLDLRADSALYCPPDTEHNVTNTGHRVLRYVYVVAATE